MAYSKDASKVVQLDGQKLIIAPGHLLVRPNEEEITVGGIIQAGSQKPRVGTLIAQGERIHEMPEYPIGWTLHYLKTNSLEVELNGEKLLLINFQDIRLAVEP